MYRLLASSVGRSASRRQGLIGVLAAAGGVAAYETLRPRQSLHLDNDGSIAGKLKEKASDLKDAIADRSPLKPQSPSGVAGARTSHNPSTSMNHGQTAGESDHGQPSPTVAAEKKRQKQSANATDNDAKKPTAREGGGATAKIASGHTTDADGKRVPRHDLPGESGKASKGKKASSSSSGTGDKPTSPTGDAARSAGAATAGAGATAAVVSGLSEKQEEAESEEAFNEETGEINWDCPCLGGMAHGPCGEDFKAAFSCFVYSKEEPKGKECLDKFKAMQECFKQHPEIYGDLTRDDETPEGKAVQ